MIMLYFPCFVTSTVGFADLSAAAGIIERDVIRTRYDSKEVLWLVFLFRL